MGHLDHYNRAQVERLLALDPLIGFYNVDFMTSLATVVTYPRDHQSAAFTTDSLGFRVGEAFGRQMRVDELGPEDKGYGLVLGSSSAFGYGASSDSQTLASHLSAATGRPYYNLGVPGANSHQLLSVAATERSS